MTTPQKTDTTAEMQKIREALKKIEVEADTTLNSYVLGLASEALAVLDTLIKAAQHKPVVEVTVEERGWAGHFICADRCRFRRNTLITHKDKRIIVSTVGLMERYDYEKPWNKTGEFETLGNERYYETMAFEAKWEEPYWEADVSREVHFENPWRLNETKRTSDAKANKMHDEVVRELSIRIIPNKEEV